MFLITYKSHYLVFKELFSFEKSYDLSKPSKTINKSAKITRINLYVFLHRKEVIPPHVPVGIPCYDFTPVADPTFDGPLL